MQFLQIMDQFELVSYLRNEKFKKIFNRHWETSSLMSRDINSLQFFLTLFQICNYMQSYNLNKEITADIIWEFPHPWRNESLYPLRFLFRQWLSEWVTLQLSLSILFGIVITWLWGWSGIYHSSHFISLEIKPSIRENDFKINRK